MNDKNIVVEAQQLRKSYGARLALDRVSLDLRAGEVVGLLGPNGAGKTTTLSILATLISPDDGMLRILGFDAGNQQTAIRKYLGLVPQSLALYPSLSAAQNLRLFLRIHGLHKSAAREACAQALETVGLADRARDQVATLSGGMQRRLNLACGIAHRPKILLLDEACIGVDPQSRSDILRTIRRLANAGAAAVYSTHYMEEVERLCDRVVMIDHGRIIASGTIAEIIAMADSRPRMEFTFAGPTPASWYEDMEAIELPSRAGASDRVTLALPTLDALPELLQRARKMPGGLQQLSIRTPNLSDAFMILTGHALRSDEPT